jgi:hypothetical protein
LCIGNRDFGASFHRSASSMGGESHGPVSPDQSAWAWPVSRGQTPTHAYFA